MATYLVVGSSRGIGLELTIEILESYKDSKVIAGARKPHEATGLQELHKAYPTRLSFVTIDTQDTNSVKAAAEDVSKSHPEGVDYIINNAGILGNPTLDADDLVTTFNTNVAGPTRVIQAFMPLLLKGKSKTVVNVSSRAGAVNPQVQQGVGQFFRTFDPSYTFHGYRASKAALNLVSITLSQAYAKDGVTIIALHPGAVATDMFWNNGATDSTVSKLNAITPKESAVGSLKTMHKLTFADSGKFFNYDGEELQF